MLHLGKQLIGTFATPLGVAVLLAGIAALLRGRRKLVAARYMFAAAAIIAFLGTLPVVGDLLIRPLESRYLPLLESQVPAEASHIVVLGSGYNPGQQPITSALDPYGLVRIVEGVRLARRFTGSQLVVSGGSVRKGYEPATGYALLARQLGVSDPSLVILDTPLDTSAEARALAGTLGKGRFVLVTSAFHMPRAMKRMQENGLNPIAAPTGFLSDHEPMGWRDWVPNASGLNKTERALHEYLGFLAMAAGIE